MESRPVLKTRISRVSISEAAALIAKWGRRRESRAVYLCNVHSVVTATRDDQFANALSAGDLVAADGAPVAWLMRRLDRSDQQRVGGPDLMPAVCVKAAEDGTSIFLYGSTESTLAVLSSRLKDLCPRLVIAGTYSPPFRPLLQAEQDSVRAMINASGAGIVWVGLGCPKQELWIAENTSHIHAVLVGVGAAFDYLSGRIARAPRWMQSAGLEWLHRLLSEPRRLWKRYLVTNTLFCILATGHLLRTAFERPRAYFK